MTAFPSVATPLAGAVRKTQTPHLRSYQASVESGIYAEWAAGKENVLAVVPTGGGKTVIFSSILSKHQGGAVAIAHRQELVGQIALSLNNFGVRHRIIAPKKVRQLIIERQMREHGVTFYDPNAPIGVAGVDTLVKIDKGARAAEYAQWRAQVRLWVQDEAHHVLEGNKWGKATELFTGAKGLGVTASPRRADGKGLGRECGDGLFDALVLGPTMRDLINDGYLTPYEIWTVPCSVKYDEVDVGASGEFVKAKLVAAEDGADLVGDIVSTYLQRAKGKLGVTFVSSVKKAHEVAAAYNAAGVPARALSGEDSDEYRAESIQMLERRQLMQLVNCDLFGEGFDLPAIEVVSMGTATASLARYMQWFGRALRLMLSALERMGYDDLTPEGRRAVIAASAKARAIILDHGGNVIRHKGPPDIPHVWSLARPGSRASTTAEAVGYRVCANPGLVLANPAGPSWADFREVGWSNDAMLQAGHLVDTFLPCAHPYERIHRLCPHCGFMPEPVTRSDPQHVEGDLELLDETALAALLGTQREAERSNEEYRDYLYSTGLPATHVMHRVKHHDARRQALELLKQAMGYWGGHWKARGDNDSQLQRRFFHTFGVDVVTAQALKRAEAEALHGQIIGKLVIDGVVIPG